MINDNSVVSYVRDTYTTKLTRVGTMFDNTTSPPTPYKTYSIELTTMYEELLNDPVLAPYLHYTEEGIPLIAVKDYNKWRRLKLGGRLNTPKPPTAPKLSNTPVFSHQPMSSQPSAPPLATSPTPRSGPLVNPASLTARILAGSTWEDINQLIAGMTEDQQTHLLLDTAEGRAFVHVGLQECDNKIQAYVAQVNIERHRRTTDPFRSK